jgi:2-haloacid dehalogenase
MSVQAVIFDIGNVLVEWQPERYFDRVYGAERCQRMFAEVDLHGMNLMLDSGADWQSTVYDWADRYPEWDREIRDWYDNWIQLAAPLIPQSLRQMRALKRKGVPVFALTNFGAQSFAYAQGEYVFLSEFDRAYVSGRMKLIKPDPAIYEAVEVDCGLAPQSLFFTDDRLENIEAAKARGWQTHLFEGPAGLARRLVELGLLTPDEGS